MDSLRPLLGPLAPDPSCLLPRFLATFVAWLGFIIYVYIHGSLETHLSWLGVEFICQGIGTFFTKHIFCLVECSCSHHCFCTLLKRHPSSLGISLTKSTSLPSPGPKPLDHANAILILIRRSHFISPSICNVLGISYTLCCKLPIVPFLPCVHVI